MPRLTQLFASSGLIARLRPAAGRALPAELEPARVMQTAEQFAGGVRDPQFEEVIRRIDTGPLHRGNQVTVFFDGEEAFDAIREAIEAATSEVLFETYIFKDDETGQGARQLLARAARRGVRVRVLADGWGSFTTRKGFWDRMQREGIEGRLFHPLWSHWRHRKYRDHRKIVVVDRRVAFTGGMNVANEYGSALHSSGQVWRDTHVRIEGQTAWEMALVFAEAWLTAGGAPFDITALEPSDQHGVKVLILDTRAGRGHHEMSSVLAAIFGAARRRVWITNAYFAPGHRTVEFLGRVADRGVDVRLLLPGLSDVPIVKHAAHGYYADLLSRGVRIFEYQRAVLHAKTLLADDYVSVIGSSNLDFRSFRYNAECNALALDEATGRIMAETFEEDLRQSMEIKLDAWRQRGALHRCGDGLARR